MPQPEPQFYPQPPLATYHLSTILSQASTHPIYSPLLRNATSDAPLTLQSFDFVTKDHLLSSFDHLQHTNPSFLHSIYISPTGGTRSGPTTHLYFFTSTVENRAQRALASTLLSTINVFEPTDITINLHGGVPMYRCQDLMGSLIDNCGATDLSIGSNATDAQVLAIGKRFDGNVIAAPSSRLLQFARYMYGLKRANGGEGEVGLKLKKVVFTSEPLSKAQEGFLKEALGVETVASVYGSAEAGPWGGAPPQPIADQTSTGAMGEGEVPGKGFLRSFVFDRRQMIVEIIDGGGNVLDDSTNLRSEPTQIGEPIVGEIVLTSLTRHWNPLLRYRTGDFGSLHSISTLHGTQELLKRNTDAAENLCHIIMYGRSPNSSFFLDSDYIDIVQLDRQVFANPEWDVLEWQIIIYPLSDEELKLGDGKLTGDGLEFRVVRKCEGATDGYKERLRKEIVEKVISEHVSVVVKVVDYDGLEKGRMARKVMKIVDRRI
ncbi:hypothetical protein BC938DRAFT_473717 [Jimgerdemannia flammicorona]|uniref:AMP-dependent synthetase/ligase domain-containing protein n=1 Tax=Jimgerdemannia flammicorona TaxID=994334 RepID=A0A433Q3H4_9FUNG|nr:hypothetical protein BC938DRAFT_473717 [Jimgerdemannia flammicorona]